MTYNFQIKYTPGKKNVFPEAISCREDLETPETSYHTHNIQQVLEHSHFLKLITTSLLYTNLSKEIQEEQLMNPPTSTTDLVTKDNICYHDNSLYVSQGPLRNQIIQAFYYTPSWVTLALPRPLKESPGVIGGPQCHSLCQSLTGLPQGRQARPGRSFIQLLLFLPGYTNSHYET
ncbi:hypothetical protein DSO57_1004359 [Entomophthora muscae]|uniref:Uncharacterized protein n=1 Tax=Entomophthora muscae TaxID=34485 RepID=A0ACC2T8A3_9FUNG|nr:hypothetical protein DSO57_1004359 [Entomophthora muscae]